MGADEQFQEGEVSSRTSRGASEEPGYYMAHRQFLADNVHVLRLPPRITRLRR